MKTYYEWFEEQKLRPHMRLGQAFQCDFDTDYDDKMFKETDPQKAGLMIFKYLVNSKLWPHVPQVGRFD